MRYVLLDETNVVIDVQSNFSEGYIEAPDEVTNGHIYDPLEGTFSPPPPPPLERWQLLYALAGYVEAQAQAERDAAREILLDQLLALYPGAPDLPENIGAFNDFLGVVTWPQMSANTWSNS